jgi:hypothetical protein
VVHRCEGRHVPGEMRKNPSLLLCRLEELNIIYFLVTFFLFFGKTGPAVSE